MKKMICYSILTFFWWLGFVKAEILVTPSYIIEIKNNCEEGNLSCDNVSYKGTRKSDQSSIELIGKTLNKRESFDLYGYMFKNGGYYYYIYINEAEFIIEKNNKVISSEKGEWRKESAALIQKENCVPLSFTDEDGNKDIYRSGNKCFYRNITILNTYNLYMRENLNNEVGRYLRKEIESNNNYHDVINEGNLEISYTWSNPQSLKVQLSFAGGITTLLFEEKLNDTEVITIYDAD